MQGYNDVTIQVPYDTIAAYSVSTQVDGASGGTYYQGIRINWSTDEVAGIGIINGGWYTDDFRSPFYGAQESDIISTANSQGNLNSYFGSWSATMEDKLNFMSMVVGCCTEV